MKKHYIMAIIAVLLWSTLLKDGFISAAGDKSIITPEHIQEVYDMEVKVAEAGGFPLVIPV